MNYVDTKTETVNSIGFAVLVTGFCFFVALIFGWVHPTPAFLIELFAVFTSYSCTYLCVKQSRFNYVIGAVSVALYAIVFWMAGLYASMALQFYLFPVMLYGWFRWKSDDNTRPVTSVFSDGAFWIAIYVLVIVAAYGGVYNINYFFSGNMAGLDTSIFVASIFAQFLMDNKKIENWIVWAIVNVVSIYVYWNQGLYFVFMQYVFFLGNTIWGFYSWHKSRNI